MTVSQITYRFAPDVKSVCRDGLRLSLKVESWKTLDFHVSASSHADAIEALSGGGATLDRLAGIAAGAGPTEDGLAAVTYFIERFSRARLLEWSIYDHAGEVGHVVSLTSGYRPLQMRPPDDLLSLCRFAYIRKTPEGMLLESGAVRAHMLITAHGMPAIGRVLAKPVTVRQDQLAEVLWRFGFLDLDIPSETDHRKCWEFHDLLMHESSRFNRNLPAGGSTYRFNGKFESSPAVKPPMRGERIALPSVDVGMVRASSSSLDALQARRASIRAFADTPVTLPTLGQFLWRVARTTRPVSRPGPQEIMGRAYPAGGSINELEFYVAVGCCEGLDQGFYHYDSHGHALVRVGDARAAQAILRSSALTMGLQPGDRDPDVTIVVSSRLPRLAWKYERMAYRATLMHAGVVIELMYLVATDMNLAPCANGSGDSRLFERATGLDPFEEVAIAEFCIGRPAAAQQRGYNS